MAQPNKKKQFGLIVAIVMVAAGVLILLANASIGEWPQRKLMQWIAIVLLGLGLCIAVGLGLMIMYRQLVGPKRKPSNNTPPSPSAGTNNRAAEFDVTPQQNDDDESDDLESAIGNAPAYLMRANTLNVKLPISATEGENQGDTAGQPKTGEKSIAEKIKVFTSMQTNVRTIKEFYQISKDQAKFAFLVSVLSCATAVVVLLLLIVLAAMGFHNDAATLAGIIASSVSGLFGGTIFVLQKTTVSQFNRFYEALHDNEMLLASLSVVTCLTPENRDTALMKIIEATLKCMTDNSKDSPSGDTDETAAKPTGSDAAAKPTGTKPTGQAGASGKQKPGAPASARKTDGG